MGDSHLSRVKSLKIVKIDEIPDKVWKLLNNDNGLKRAAVMLQYEYGDEVLEVGPGRGHLAVIICTLKPEIKSYYGLELEPEFRDQCEKLAQLNNVTNATFLLGDGCAMRDFADNRFATVLLPEVLEHVPEPLTMLNEAYRVLAKGGNLIVTVPAKGTMPPGKTAGHLHDFTVTDIKTMLGAAGFRLLHHTKHIYWEFYLSIK